MSLFRNNNYYGPEELVNEIMFDLLDSYYDSLDDINESELPGIKDVIFHDPATIVRWDDGTKTVVKCENEPYDKEKGLAMAIVKKSIGLREFFKWIDAR